MAWEDMERLLSLLHNPGFRGLWRIRRKGRTVAWTVTMLKDGTDLETDEHISIEETVNEALGMLE